MFKEYREHKERLKKLQNKIQQSLYNNSCKDVRVFFPSVNEYGIKISLIYSVVCESCKTNEQRNIEITISEDYDGYYTTELDVDINDSENKIYQFHEYVIGAIVSWITENNSELKVRDYDNECYEKFLGKINA